MEDNDIIIINNDNINSEKKKSKEEKSTKICHIGFDCERYANRSAKNCKGCGWYY